MVRVLVVEDDPTLREMVAQILEGEGYIVDCAAHGAAAVHALIGPQPPAVMLLDLLMPIMDGLAVYEWMHTHLAPPAQPQVIVLSATSALFGHLPRAAFALAKPFGIDALLDAVQRCLALHGEGAADADRAVLPAA